MDDTVEVPARANALRPDYNATMFALAKHRLLHAWIALLAILFGLLAPNISYALAGAGGNANMVEMCTASGMQLVELPASGSGKQPAMHAMSHCAFCSSHATAPALPTPSLAALTLSGWRTVYPELFYSAPRLLHAWSASAPRGPPRAA